MIITLHGLSRSLLAAVLLALPTPTLASGFLTAESPFITLDPGVPMGSSVKAIISSGDIVGGVLFEGLPDGIGIVPAGTNSGGPTTVHGPHSLSCLASPRRLRDQRLDS